MRSTAVSALSAKSSTAAVTAMTTASTDSPQLLESASKASQLLESASPKPAQHTSTDGFVASLVDDPNVIQPTPKLWPAPPCAPASAPPLAVVPPTVVSAALLPGAQTVPIEGLGLVDTETVPIGQAATQNQELQDALAYKSLQVDELQRQLGEVRQIHSSFVQSHMAMNEQLRSSLEEEKEMSDALVSSNNELRANLVGRDEEVARLQEELKRAEFGENTSKAVQGWLNTHWSQSAWREQQLSEDGNFGPSSTKALQTFLNHKWEEVQFRERPLSVDGTWGSSTTKAMQKYLNWRWEITGFRENELTEDGICGPSTVRSLHKYLNLHYEWDSDDRFNQAMFGSHSKQNLRRGAACTSSTQHGRAVGSRQVGSRDDIEVQDGSEYSSNGCRRLVTATPNGFRRHFVATKLDAAVDSRREEMMQEAEMLKHLKAEILTLLSRAEDREREMANHAAQLKVAHCSLAEPSNDTLKPSTEEQRKMQAAHAHLADELHAKSEAMRRQMEQNEILQGELQSLKCTLSVLNG